MKNVRLNAARMLAELGYAERCSDYYLHGELNGTEWAGEDYPFGAWEDFNSIGRDDFKTDLFSAPRADDAAYWLCGRFGVLASIEPVCCQGTILGYIPKVACPRLFAAGDPRADGADVADGRCRLFDGFDDAWLHAIDAAVAFARDRFSELCPDRELMPVAPPERMPAKKKRMPSGPDNELRRLLMDIRDILKGSGLETDFVGRHADSACGRDSYYRAVACAMLPPDDPARPLNFRVCVPDRIHAKSISHIKVLKRCFAKGAVQSLGYCVERRDGGFYVIRAKDGGHLFLDDLRAIVRAVQSAYRRIKR